MVRASAFCRGGVEAKVGRRTAGEIDEHDKRVLGRRDAWEVSRSARETGVVAALVSGTPEPFSIRKEKDGERGLGCSIFSRMGRRGSRKRWVGSEAKARRVIEAGLLNPRHDG